MDLSNPPPVRASAAQAGLQAAEVARALAAYGFSARTAPLERRVRTADEDTRPHADAEGSAPRYQWCPPERGRDAALPDDADRGRLLDVWA